MYSSRGSNAYGQQSYAAQSAYAQNQGPAYSGSSVGGPDVASQFSLSSRHSTILAASQDATEVGGYRSHASATAHYGGQYGSVYSSTALSGAQQVPAINAKGAGPSALESRGGYASNIPDSPKFASGDYASSTRHAYGHKGDYAEKVPDYPGMDRRQYGEQQSAFMVRDLQSEPTGRYADSVGFNHQHQPEMYERIDQASLLRQEQLLKAQSLQSASLDGGSRQADYLAARGVASRHTTQDLMSYGGRVDADPRNLSMLSASSYGGQPAPSILGAAPRRNVDDLMYPQSSSNPGYGVSLPPGRDYGTGKGLHGTSLDADYSGSLLSRGGHPRIDERKDDRVGYLREFELREEERRREHLREREKDREREKERERERQRERERERERERILERREKERERERKRALETKHERTSPRVSRDRHGSSLSKEGRSLRRDSPRHEASHRRLSPVKEKRREYICKVHSSCLVDVERDYLSIDKRYPRLFVSPELSKVVVHWPKENLKLSIHTPVSFEHDFVEEEGVADPKVPSTKLFPEEPVNSEHGSTLWNAKMILMSGLSRNALEELSSEKISDDRIPHICNILRFAVCKKDHAFMAIGGPWDSTDGSNPSVDDSSLIKTALRYAKDVTQLDLQNCLHWNRFLEIHYDRVGKDGLFSHKEVTVLFVPDLSECLPSLDTWRAQWVAHKKAVAERERQYSLKKERSREKKEVVKDKEMDSSNGVERIDKSDKKKEPASSGQAVDVNKKDKGVDDMKGNAADKKGDGNDRKVEIKDSDKTGEEGKNVEKKEKGETAGAQTAGSAKPGKKKIIKRIVKQKVTEKTTGAENTDSKQNDKLVEKDIGEPNPKSEISGQQEESSADNAVVKTFIRKKVIKKVPVGKTAQNEDKGMLLEVKAEKEMNCSEDKPKDNSDPSSTAAVQESSVKTTIKKKIIRRVPKRKVIGNEANDGAADTKKDGDSVEKNVVMAENETENTGKQAPNVENQVSEVKKTEKKIIPKMKSKTSSAEKANSSKTEIKASKEDKKDEKGTGVEAEADQKIPQKDNHNGNRGKSKDEKDESRSNSNKELKEKRKPEEPPRHPGLVLQTKGSKDSKLRSLSLSLDSLLDYTDNDVEESTFELSLFAESLYEMLQYQMGCRLLTFLQKLRIKFVTKRNQRKRQREEIREKENDKKPSNDKKSSTKRLKTNELPVKTKSEVSSAAQPDDEKMAEEDANADDHVNEVKLKDETDDDEDPEEDPEEYEEMEDASPQHNSPNENNKEKEKIDKDAEPEKEASKEENNAEESTKNKTIMKAAETKPKSEKEGKVETGKKDYTVDKELLQAFRFFDRNRVGYIRVEDMRLIIHNLGKYLSHRDVKELVQSALLESNTARDDRILYNRLVRMSDMLDWSMK